MRGTAQHPTGVKATGARAIAERLFAEQRPQLLRIARRNSATGEDAEEALQDAFVLFIAHFDPDGNAPPIAWLTLTLKRRCWALYRSRSRQHAARLTPGDPRNPAEELIGDPRLQPEERRERTERIARARVQLATLKPHERRALGLLALGYSYREICALTGWTYTKVNRCITEGRAALRELAADGDLSLR